MFNDTIIVQSAVSAFNNAALMAPAFFWWALLCLPLFLMVRMCADCITGRIGLTRDNVMVRASALVMILTFAWIILFGGNYNVLRDSASVLPFIIAAIVLAITMFIGAWSRGMQLPRFRDMAHGARWRTIGLMVLGVIVIGASDMHAWWGPLLQVGAVIVGFVLGRALYRVMRPMTWMAGVIIAVTSVMLMQPEFFRFGQLGNLTAFHLLFLGFTGVAAVAAAALRNINPRGRIHHSAYVKLKWMIRFVCALGVVLFIMTESVPVFLGMLGAVFVMFAMSVWHAGADSDVRSLGQYMLAMAIGLFGVITTMPAVTAIGLLYWGVLPRRDVWRDAKFLL